MKNPYTKEEKKVMDNLVKAFNRYSKLKRNHPSELEDFARGIHLCQDTLNHRILQRDYPKTFPTYGSDNN